MGPYEPLAMKPRICYYRRTVHFMFSTICFFYADERSRVWYLELVSCRKSPLWELRQKDGNGSWRSGLCVLWRQEGFGDGGLRVFWRQEGFGDGGPAIRSHRPRKHGGVGQSVIDGEPHVWEEPMTESTLSSWSFSLDDEELVFIILDGLNQTPSSLIQSNIS